MDEIIAAEHVTFLYENEDGEDTNALKDVSIKIYPGEFVAVLGHNGSGKSTLAKHFNAILQPNKGVVYVNKIDTKNEEMLFDIRQCVGMVFQNPDNQIVSSVVEQDVAFAPENLGVEPSEIRKRVDEALKDVDMYAYRLNAPSQLSGGQKQRIAIAGIIAMRPQCIVLDEATAMLDPKGRKEVMSIIRKLNKGYNSTIVHITHYMEEAVLADRVVVIDNGSILLDDTPRKVFTQVETLKNVGLAVPQVTELAFELRKAGINIPLDILNEEVCVNELVKLLEE